MCVKHQFDSSALELTWVYRSLTLLNVLEIILYYSDVSSQCFISVYHDSISLVASMGWTLGVLHTPVRDGRSRILTIMLTVY